jgi:hypothetical protein
VPFTSSHSQVTGFDPTSRQGRYHGTTYGNFAGQLDLGARLETGAVTFLGTRYQAWLKDHAGKLRQAMSRYRGHPCRERSPH